MKRFLVSGISILTAALFVVCLSNLIFAGADDAYKMQYKIAKGVTLKYNQTTESEQIMEMMGSEQTVNATTNSQIQITSEGFDSKGHLVYVMQVTSFKIDLDSGMLDTTLVDPEALVGKRIQKVIGVHGDQVKSSELDSIKLNPMFSRIFTSDSEFLPNLPTAELKMGVPVKQTDTDTSKSRSGKNVIKSDMEFTLQGTESKLGYDCLKIDFKGEVSIVGNGNYRGMMDYALEGDGEVSGTMYFAHKEGIVVATSSTSDMELTMAFTGQQSMTIPLSQTLTSKLTLVK